LEIKVNNQQDWLVEWRKCEEALEAERKKREEAEMERDNYLRCLNGSTKAKYTAELYDKEVERAEAAEAQVEVLREAIASIVLEPQVPGDDTSGIAEFDILPALAAWYERRDVGEEEHF
jgi:hypothetical protein